MKKILLIMKTRARYLFGRFTVFSLIIVLTSINFQTHAQGWRAITSQDPDNCDVNTSVAQTPDGGYLVASHYTDPISNLTMNPRVHKVDQDGKILWSKDYLYSSSITVMDIIACSDGNFLIAGHETTSGDFVPFGMKIDGSGTIIWKSNIATITDKSILIEHVKESANGDYFMVGSILDQTMTPYRVFSYLLKMDALGNEDWSFVNIDDSFAHDVVENSDGSIMLSGSLIQNTFRSSSLSKLTSTGNLIWDAFYYPSSMQTAVAIEPIGTGYLLGINQNIPQNSIVLMRTDLNGNELWSTNVGITDDYVEDIHLTNDGNILLNGGNSTTGGGMAIKLNMSGGEIWRNDIAGNKVLHRGVENQYGAFICSGIKTNLQQGQSFVGNGFTVDWLFGCGNNTCGSSTRGASVTAIPNIPTPGPYTYLWSNGGANATNNSLCANSTYVVTISDANGVWHVATVDVPVSQPNIVELIKLDKNGILYSNVVQGNVFDDANNDCLYSAGETGYDNWMVRLTGDESLVKLTDSLGNYSFELDSGSYNLTTILPNALFGHCNQSYAVSVIDYDSIYQEIPVKKLIDCPMMDLQVASSAIRRCSNSIFQFNYCNNGTIDAIGAYVEVTFDTSMTIVSSTITPSSQSGSTYTYPIGDVQVNSCGSFSVTVLNSCFLILGQALCVNSHIYPDTICIPPQSIWDGSITDVQSDCALDSITFTIENIGQNPMSNPLEYQVAEDNVILKSDFFQLTPNQTKFIKVPSNGSTYRIYAEQSPGYFPGNYKPTTFVEGCGTNSSGGFSVGFVNNFPITDNTNSLIEICPEVVGPLDPNDKSAIPKGVGVDHIIEQNVDLNYRIRFQNIGTDTAFNVVIRDTLSDQLDITSIVQGGASHHYRLEIVGNNILKFIFPDILLVDSTTNEPGSHGFVNFRISQLDSLPLGTMIYNSAAIYFDYEAPVITNQTFHEVGEFFIEMTTSQDQLEQSLSQVQVFPNPFNEYADIVLKHQTTSPKELRVCDVMGRTVLAETLHDNRYRIYRNQLPVGTYFFTISDPQQLINSGKFVIK